MKFLDLVLQDEQDNLNCSCNSKHISKEILLLVCTSWPVFIGLCFGNGKEGRCSHVGF